MSLQVAQLKIKIIQAEAKIARVMDLKRSEDEHANIKGKSCKNRGYL
jgi:hypothetical protein